MAPRRKKIGRPPLPGGPKRHVAVYVPQEAAEKFELAAKSAGFEGVSPWAAKVLLSEAERELRGA